MAKARIMTNVFSVIANFSLDDLEKVRKRKPKALKITEMVTEDGETYAEERFCVMKGTVGDISPYGIVFGDETVSDKKAVVTEFIPNGTEDVRKYVADKIGMAVIHLNKVEEQVENALAEIKAEDELVDSSIEMDCPVDEAEDA